jgi:hypothetical protein
MNLNEIQDILNTKLGTTEELSTTIINILKIARKQSHNLKKEVIEIIERDCDK